MGSTYSGLTMIRLTRMIRAVSGWRRAVLALAAGLLAALALPPLNLWPVLFIAVPGFLLLLEGLQPRQFLKAFLTGWLFGLGYFALAFHWIGYAFLVDAATYLWMMPFAVGGLAAAMAIYWGLASVAVNAFGWRGLRLAAGFAAALSAAEWLRGHLFTGFPWAAPGLAADGMGAVAQLASVIGMTGLTLMVILWAGLPLAVIGRRPAPWWCRGCRTHGSGSGCAPTASASCPAIPWWRRPCWRVCRTRCADGRSGCS